LESITIEYEGREYTGTFDIVKVDKTTFSFNVSFKDYYRDDSSLFKSGSEQQMKNHARSVLKGLVKQYLSKKNA
jgi:hypothetical protein